MATELLLAPAPGNRKTPPGCEAALHRARNSTGTLRKTMERTEGVDAMDTGKGRHLKKSLKYRPSVLHC